MKSANLSALDIRASAVIEGADADAPIRLTKIAERARRRENPGVRFDKMLPAGTNRVKVLRPNGKPSKGRVPPSPKVVRTPKVAKQPKLQREPKPTKPTGKGFYKQDGTLDGKGTKIICISIPPAELAKLDEFCRRIQMNRSHMFRQAWKLFQSKIVGDEE